MGCEIVGFRIIFVPTFDISGHFTLITEFNTETNSFVKVNLSRKKYYVLCITDMFVFSSSSVIFSSFVWGDEDKLVIFFAFFCAMLFCGCGIGKDVTLKLLDKPIFLSLFFFLFLFIAKTCKENRSCAKR